MGNLAVKLNLAGLKHTVQKMTGSTGEVEVLIIPIDANHLYRGEKGMYLDLTAFELKEVKDKNTHLLKQSFPKEVYSKQTDEEKKAMPILGNVLTWDNAGSGNNEAAVNTSAPGQALPW
jgi:hypothetical protein